MLGIDDSSPPEATSKTRTQSWRRFIMERSAVAGSTGRERHGGWCLGGRKVHLDSRFGQRHFLALLLVSPRGIQQGPRDSAYARPRALGAKSGHALEETGRMRENLSFFANSQNACGSIRWFQPFEYRGFEGFRSISSATASPGRVRIMMRRGKGVPRRYQGAC